MIDKEQITYIKVCDLKGSKRNPRKNDEAVNYVAESIRRYGFRNPLIVDKDNTVWCGNTRLKASKVLGLEEVPCIVVDNLTPKQMQELALLDNKTNEIAEWDKEMLAEILTDCDLDDFGLDWDLKEEKEQEEVEADIPFVEVLNEEHNYIVLYFDNEVDWLQAESLFDLQTKKNYSTRKDGKIERPRTGVGRVIRGAEAINKIRGAL